MITHPTTTYPTTTYPTHSAEPADGGSATLLVLALGAVLALAAVVATLLGQVSVARHRADTAADLAALAAAQVAAGGSVTACHRAGEVARSAGASLVACSLGGAISDVTVMVRLPGLPGQLGPVLRRARAGPGGTRG